MNPKAAKSLTKSPQKASPRPMATPAPKSTKPKATPVPNHLASLKANSGNSRATKQSRLIALLRSASGGTIEQMQKLTGWQAHTVRATINAVLRKRLGLDVQSIANADGPRIYRIAKSVVA